MGGFVSRDAYDCTISHLCGGVVSESKRGSLDSINQLMRENRVSDLASPNLALGMRPIKFAVTASASCAISKA